MASFCIPAHLYALPRCNAFLFAPLKGVCESTVVQQEAHWLRCQRYIELNPCALVWSVTLATIDGQALARTLFGLSPSTPILPRIGDKPCRTPRHLLATVESGDKYWRYVNTGSVFDTTLGTRKLSNTGHVSNPQIAYVDSIACRLCQQPRHCANIIFNARPRANLWIFHQDICRQSEGRGSLQRHLWLWVFSAYQQLDDVVLRKLCHSA